MTTDEPDRDRIRVARQRAGDEPDPHEARAWGCCVVGFLSGCLVTTTAALAILKVTR